MGDVLYLVLRRLRAPLITLIVVYAVSIAGLVAIPGVDPEGRPGTMSYFHALYVMSYTATTIGFGEIPYPFTDAQRLWVIVAIYLSVIGWAYAIGSVFSLSQDATFRAAAARSLFMRRVARLSEPYCVLCGYGRSGAAIARALDALGVRLVIVDTDPSRIAGIAVQPFGVAPLVLVADARRPEVLRDAGIANPDCRAVLALTGDDEANQSIAIGTKVLDPSTRVIARAIDPVVAANLAEFGGIQVIDPFRSFAANVGLDFAAPEVLQLEEWLTGAPGTEPPSPLRLPPGHWVLAGFGRFGQALARALDAAGQSWQAFDPVAALQGASADRVHASGGTDDGLRAAGIERAVGVIAGTDSDTVNLAVVKMARRANPSVKVIVRQNKAFNQALIEAARPDVTFVQADLLLHEVLQSLTTPLLERFLERAPGGPAYCGPTFGITPQPAASATIAQSAMRRVRRTGSRRFITQSSVRTAARRARSPSIIDSAYPASRSVIVSMARGVASSAGASVFTPSLNAKQCTPSAAIAMASRCTSASLRRRPSSRTSSLSRASCCGRMSVSSAHSQAPVGSAISRKCSFITWLTASPPCFSGSRNSPKKRRNASRTGSAGSANASDCSGTPPIGGSTNSAR